jgi:hypothetical protein
MVKGKSNNKKLKDDVTAHGCIGAVGTSEGSNATIIEGSISELRALIGLFMSLRHRDSMFKSYGINRSEMWILCSLEAYLITHGCVLVSQQLFIDYLNGTFKTKRKFRGYVEGLHRLECIKSFEYIRNPGSLSIGITDFGFTVLNAYYSQMSALFDRYRHIPPGKKIKSVSFTENIPSYYRPY